MTSFDTLSDSGLKSPTSRKNRSKAAYNFEQLTTARRPFIFDLTFQYLGGGSIQVDCVLNERSLENTPSVSSRSAAGVTVPVLRLFGIDWVSWAHACRVMNISRQFLNYRIMNDQHSVEVIRMNADSAHQLEAFLGNENWLWQPVKKACHFILLDLDQLLKNDHIKPHSRMVKSKDSDEVDSLSENDSMQEDFHSHRKRRHSESEQVVPMENEPRNLRRRSVFAGRHHGEETGMEDDVNSIQKAANHRKQFAARIRAQQDLQMKFQQYVGYVHQQSACSTPTIPSSSPACQVPFSPLASSTTPLLDSVSSEWEPSKLMLFSEADESAMHEQSVPQHCAQ